MPVSTSELDDATGTADPDEEELGEDNEDDQAKVEQGLEAFRETAGQDGEIDAYELKDMLNDIFLQGRKERLWDCLLVYRCFTPVIPEK